jgi:hypothetical protein
MMNTIESTRHVYPAVLTPPRDGSGRWRVRFPDLVKENQVKSDTLEAATLAASVLLKQHLSPFDHRWRNIPSPTRYEDVAVEEGETVQLIVASQDSPEATPKGSGLRGIIFCLVVVFLFWSFAMLSASHSCYSTPAEAANIISELRNLKGAVMMYKRDNLDTFSNLLENENYLTLLLPYMDYPKKYSTETYAFRIVNGRGWVGYSLDRKSNDLLEKLEGKAKSTGLFGSPSLEEPLASVNTDHFYKSSDGAVWLVALAPQTKN